MGYTPPHLNVRKITGGYSIFPNGATTDDFKIYPNEVDTTPNIQLLGNSHIYLDVPVGGVIMIQYAGTSAGYISANATDVEVQAYGARDLLLTTGTGVVKFGTWTASGDVAVNGSIAVKDALGNARKLATIA